VAQVWRLLTNFRFVGKFSMNFVMSLMWMCARARPPVPRARSVRRTADCNPGATATGRAAAPAAAPFAALARAAS
jgi:hypothetical protein